MTNRQAITILKKIITVADKSSSGIKEIDGTDEEAIQVAIKALEQAPCDDAISRKAVLKQLRGCLTGGETEYQYVKLHIDSIPSIKQERIGHCKDCKYFEYDSVAKVDGVPLIVAHEICSRWGDGCKTKEDGYCFLFEPQEERGKE